MTIYRCNHCGSVAETNLAPNTTSNCAKCSNEVKIYDAAFYVQSLLQRYFALNKEFKQLQETHQILENQSKQLHEQNQALESQLKTGQAENKSAPNNSKPKLPQDIADKIKSIFNEQANVKLSAFSTDIRKILPDFDQTKYGFKKKFLDFVRQCDFLVVKGEAGNAAVSLKKSPQKQPEKTPAKPKINLNDTDLFANQETVEKIKQYLNNKNLTATFDYDALDMSGYFDESSEIIGDNFALLEKHLKSIRYMYHNDKVGLTINCEDLSKNESQKLQEIFKQLFDYTIFAKYFYHNDDKKIRITLNTAESVKKFMLGGWLEWFAAIKLIKQVHGKGKKFAIAR
ncbi:MAG: hypothetical protein IJ566_08080 [Cardiobacteriaceae bacterium]|nr:hypothetical protein [Cardiobacteriaceae bacterium]